MDSGASWLCSQGCWPGEAEPGAFQGCWRWEVRMPHSLSLPRNLQIWLHVTLQTKCAKGKWKSYFFKEELKTHIHARIHTTHAHILYRQTICTLSHMQAHEHPRSMHTYTNVSCIHTTYTHHMHRLHTHIICTDNMHTLAHTQTRCVHACTHTLV